MSVLSTSEATPNRVIAALRLLADAGEEGVKRTDLRRLLSPPTLRAKPEGGTKEDTIAQGVVAECAKSGFAVDEEGSLRLSPPLAKVLGTRDFNLDDARLALADSLLSAHDRDAENWRFSFVAAWFLAQDPMSFPGTNVDAPAQFHSQVRERAADEAVRGIAVNQTSWDNFCYWASFLGIGRWQLGPGTRPTRGCIPDPTPLLELYLKSTNELARARQIATVMEHLAQRWPVFDPDREGSEVAPYVPKQESGNTIRPAMACAWLVLETRRVVQLDDRADARNTNVLAATGGRRVSHVTAGEEQ